LTKFQVALLVMAMKVGMKGAPRSQALRWMSWTAALRWASSRMVFCFLTSSSISSLL